MAQLSTSAGRPAEEALLRAARAALGWSVMQAGRHAKVSIGTVLAAEGRRPRPASPADVDSLWRGYGAAGVSRFADGAGLSGILLVPGELRHGEKAAHRPVDPRSGAGR